MSQAAWYPETPRSRLNFFLRTFPIFVALVAFFYFGLDWLGAFEFLEVLVRDNSSWLMNIIYGIDYSEFTRDFYQRVDPDPLIIGGDVPYGELFPGIILTGYSKILLIVRACTGMEAGALLAALILVTPAKWENKAVAQVVNFLMMHIGNTFRVAFHFWFTRYLHLSVGLSEDQAFYYAHDMLSKVFGFIGIVIFTLVIERTGVKIVSTFGAWLDAFAEGAKRVGGMVKGKTFYIVPGASAAYNNTQDKQKEQDDKKATKMTFTEKVKHTLVKTKNFVEGRTFTTRTETIENSSKSKTFFYPANEEIEKYNWKFTGRTFLRFLIAGVLVVCVGFIPGVIKLLGTSANGIATNWFGAEFASTNPSTNGLGWVSVLAGTTVGFKITLVNGGILLLAIFVGLILATPAIWWKKLLGVIISAVITIPITLFRFGLQYYVTWSVVADGLKSSNPRRYLSMVSFATSWIPFLFTLLAIILVVVVLQLLQVKVFSTVTIWLHQGFVWLGDWLKIRKKPGEEQEEKEEKPILSKWQINPTTDEK